VRESLRTGSQGEVMKMKKGVVKQIKEITGSIKSEKQLPPCELLNVLFLVSPETAQSCQQFGVISKDTISAKKSYATGKGLEVALLGENVTAIVHICNDVGRVYPNPVNSLTCELISESNHDKINGSVLNMIEAGKYEIGYKATSRGRHKLHLKVEGEHIKGSPFPVTVKLPVQKLGEELVRTISGVKKPVGVAINQKNELLVVEYGENRILIFNSKGEKIRSFGSWGSGNAQFSSPHGIAVDDSGDILVADAGNYRIQKFSADDRFIAAVGTRGNGQLQFQFPVGIKIHPLTKKIYVTEYSNHRIQILNPDLSYFGTFGSRGSGPGQLQDPWDVAFDSANNVYVTDNGNGRIQVFTEDGKFLRLIGNKGAGKGELNGPAMITISENELYVSEKSNHRVSVFTTQGDYLTSFGTQGNGPQRFQNPYGIAVDQSGMVYVADFGNNRIQVF
jgi:tripartite motif-containing protein 2/3/tripartite motif-containing protein 71